MDKQTRRPRKARSLSRPGSNGTNATALSTQSATTALRRFTFTLPEDLYLEVQQVAAERHTTVLAVLRQFVRLGLFAAQVDDLDPNDAVVIRINGVEHRIIQLYG